VLLLRKALVFLLPVLLMVAVPSRAEDKGDLVLRNGVFHTVSAAGRVEGSLVARGGRIVYLGPDSGASRFQAKRSKVIDLAGRTVVPGLIDAHSHLLNLGLKLSSADLRGSANPVEIVERAM
jgi:predicted amidohydrolase YtcJ